MSYWMMLLMTFFCTILGGFTWSYDVMVNSYRDDTKCDPDVPSRFIPIIDEGKSEGQGSGLVCKEGEYLDWYKCSPCEEGTFRTKLMASLDRQSMCLKCQEPGMYEIVKTPCNKTRDAKITCEDGFYRHHVPGKPCLSACIRCDICGVKRNMFKPFEGRECKGYHNTVCCQEDHMFVVEGKCHHTRTATAATTTQSGEILEEIRFNLDEEETIAISAQGLAGDGVEGFASNKGCALNNFIVFHSVINALYINIFLLNL
ncbi:uncharacterized protein LOC129923703 [Biomphalaria glabrata]|uniref:Uncharacterized protein LOC129923703 n=1 Tax=Biomphalaria glabrata TaxID=6526 RepID=A0A9W2ZB15_BIOGL|nr:uncharacterized protein LOC129923703 [Biomphalaria glabrata]